MKREDSKRKKMRRREREREKERKREEKIYLIIYNRKRHLET